jgi:hypothetical protein
MDAEMPTQQEPINAGSFNTSLTPQKFYQGDPWLVLVKDKLHLDNIWSTVIFFVISILFNFSYTTFLLKDLNPTASLRDALVLLLLSVAFTSGYFIYLVLPTFMADTFDTLRANGVIGTYRQNSSKSLSYEGFVENLLVWANSRWWLVIIVIITVPVWLQNVFVVHRQIPLFWNFFSFLVGGMPGVYIVCFTLVRVVLMLVFITRLFLLFTIQVKPLHSDGSGGLGSLGHIGWINVGMIFAISLIVLVVTQRVAASPAEIIIVTASYLVSILALVFGWLAIPHHIMLQARKELLQPITDEYQQVVKETMPSITGDTASIVAGTERLSALQDRYKLLRDNFPVWPLEIMQMRRLGIALILPALLSLLPSLLDLFTKR